MGSDGQSSTRERLLDVAITLFARHGYTETSIADIQRECGLAPSSGALYKHFSSKRALMEEATRRYAERLAEDSKRFHPEPGDTTEDVLRRAATLIWQGIDDNAVLLRVLFRESMFPDLADQLWSAITDHAYARFAADLRAAVKAGVMDIADPEATAAICMAALAYYPMVRMLIGHTPGAIDPDRYLEAWIANARAVLRQAAETDPHRYPRRS